MKRTGVLAMLLTLGLSCPALAGVTGGILPHRALYDIALATNRSGSQVVDITGRMYIEVKKDCDAWTTDQRFQLYYEYPEGAPLRVTSTLSAYEPDDGKTMAFNARRTRNGDLYQELSGNAALRARKAIYSMPQDITFALPPGTLFPMTHTRMLLDKARSGAKLFNAVVFDGSDDTGPVEINAIIGGPAAPANASKAIDPDMTKVRAWKIRLAFFPLNETEEDSEYEMDAVLQDNGVIRDMTVDYRNFSVTQTLVALEPVSAIPCTGSAPGKDGH